LPRVWQSLEPQRNLDLASAFYHCKRFDANPGMGFAGLSSNGISAAALDVVPAYHCRCSCETKDELDIAV